MGTIGSRHPGVSAATTILTRLAAAVAVVTSGLTLAELGAGAVTLPPFPTLYVVSTGDDTLTEVTPSAGSIGGTVEVGSDPSAVVVTPDGKRAFVADTGSDSVTPVDLTGEEPDAGDPIAVPDRPVALAMTPDGSRVYVLSAGPGMVTPIVVATGETETPILVGPDSRDIAVHPIEPKLYVTVGPNLLWINLLDRRPSVPVTVGSDPQDIAITPNGKVVYVVRRGEGSLALLYEDQVVKTLPVGAGPEDLAISPDGRHAIVTRPTADAVVAVPLAASGDVAGTGTTIPLDMAPSDVTFAPDSETAYVTSDDGDAVVPVDVDTEEAEEPIDGLDAPVAVIAAPDQPATAELTVSSPSATTCSPAAPPGVSAVCLVDAGTVTFDASDTVPVTTEVASYTWDFGDGSASETTTIPTIIHAYTNAGTFLPTVTVVTEAGTGTARTFTGHVVGNNGSAETATASAYVRVSGSASSGPESPLVYVTEMDPAGGGQVTPILAPPGDTPRKLNPAALGRLPVYPAVAPTGRAVVAPDAVAGTVAVTAVCDGTAGLGFAAGNTVAGGLRPTRVAVAPAPTSSTASQEVYAGLVVDSGLPQLRRFDLTVAKDSCGATLAAPQQASIGLPGVPSAVAVTPDGSTAYVAVPELDAVVPVRLATGTVLAPILVGDAPRAVAVTPRPTGFVVMVANSGSDDVTVLFEDRVFATIPVGDDPQDIAISGDGERAVVANWGADTVTPITIVDDGLAVFRAEPAVDPGVDVTGIAMAPDARTAWVTGYTAGKVVAIDAIDRTVVTTLVGFRNPIGVVPAPDQPPLAGLRMASSLEVPCAGSLPAGVADRVCLDDGATVSFDASTSTPGSTPIASYTWGFGDGAAPETTTEPTTTHDYRVPGTFIATVTVTDVTGTSTTQAFTGQSTIRNGSSRALAYGIVQLTALPIPATSPVLYVTNGTTDSVTPVAIAPSGPPRVANSFAGGRSPVFPAVTPDGRAVITPNQASGEVTATAVCSDGTSLSFKPGNTVASGLSPNWAAVVPQATTGVGTRTWTVLVANAGGSEVRRFTLTVSTTATCSATLAPAVDGSVIPVGASPYGIAVTATRAWVSIPALDAVVPVDLATGTPGAPIPVGDDPRGITVTPDGATVLVADHGDGTVTPVTASTRLPGAPISVGTQPLSVAVDPTGTVALVANSGGYTVTPIAVATLDALAPVTLDIVPTAVAFTPDGATAWVASYGGNALATISTSGWSVSTVIRGIRTPIGFAVAGPRS